jgi:hypothetical protein
MVFWWVGGGVDGDEKCGFICSRYVYLNFCLVFFLCFTMYDVLHGCRAAVKGHQNSTGENTPPTTTAQGCGSLLAFVSGAAGRLGSIFLQLNEVVWCKVWVQWYCW